MAFNSKQMTLLSAVIDRMRDNRLSFEVPPMSIDNIMHTFIREEDHATLQRAGDLLNDRYQERTIRALVTTTKFGDLRTMIRLAGTKPDGSAMFLVPAYAKEDGNALRTIQPSADLEAYLTSVLDVRIDFNYIRKTLEHLDRTCEHPAHVAFFWPSIRIIADYAMKMHEGLGAKIADLVSSNTKKSVPAIHPALRVACKETAEIITAAHILGTCEKVHDPRYTVIMSTTIHNKRDTPLGSIGA